MRTLLSDIFTGSRGKGRGLANCLHGLLAAALCIATGCGGSGTADAGNHDMATADLNFGTVSFMQIETQVFVAHCSAGSMAGRTCHERTPAEGDMDLTIGNAYNNLVNVHAYISPTKLRVKPGDAANSFLWQKLNDILGPTEGNPMPFQTGGAANPLPANLLAMVQEWINQGANNN